MPKSVTPRFERVADGRAPLAVERRRRREMADARHDDAVAAGEIDGQPRRDSSAPAAAKPLRTEVRLPAP